MALSFAVAGGGTGGHVTPALALGEAIRARGDRVVFLGGEQGLENRLVPEAGFELVTLPSAQVMGRGLAGRLRGALRILSGVPAARRALAVHGVEVLISVGGYAAMPAVLAAATRRIPQAVVEPNAVPGRVNRLAARLSQRAFIGFEEAAQPLGADPARVRHFGIPLRERLVASCSGEVRPLPEAPFRVLVFGGSQGAVQINEAMLAALPQLCDLPLEIVHQTGEGQFEAVSRAYRGLDLRAEVVAFEPDMPNRYRWAHVAVCRSGALTVAELGLARLPSVLVPFPDAADDHQNANARALERVGAALRLDSRALEPGDLARALRGLFAEPQRLRAMSEAAARFAKPDAAERIVAECATLARSAQRNASSHRGSDS